MQQPDETRGRGKEGVRGVVRNEEGGEKQGRRVRSEGGRQEDKEGGRKKRMKGVMRKWGSSLRMNDNGSQGGIFFCWFQRDKKDVNSQICFGKKEEIITADIEMFGNHTINGKKQHQPQHQPAELMKSSNVGVIIREKVVEVCYFFSHHGKTCDSHKTVALAAQK
jgi:hypothetical protein